MTVEDGRYEVKLPWKCKDYLHDNRTLSEKRLEKTTEKLIAQNKYEAYNAVLEECPARKCVHFFCKKVYIVHNLCIKSE